MARSSVRIKDHHAEGQLFEQRAAIAAVIMVIALTGVQFRFIERKVTY